MAKLPKPLSGKKVVSIRLCDQTIEEIEAQMRREGIRIIDYDQRKGLPGGLAQWIKGAVMDRLREDGEKKDEGVK